LNICRVAWAHPEFGGMLATVAYDRFVNVWCEVCLHSLIDFQFKRI